MAPGQRNLHKAYFIRCTVTYVNFATTSNFFNFLRFSRFVEPSTSQRSMEPFRTGVAKYMCVSVFNAYVLNITNVEWYSAPILNSPSKHFTNWAIMKTNY